MPMSRADQWAMFFATGFYVGKIPFAPGTFGTAVALPICYLLALMPLMPALLFLCGFILFAVWAAGRAEQALGRKDPGSIVIDEMAGMAVTVFGLPFSWETVLGGFVVFRLFDILKPFPIRFLDKRLSGGVGIVLDDIAAGIMSQLILRALFYFFHP